MRACAGCRVAHKAFAGVRGLPCLAHKDVAGLADVGWAVRSRPTCIFNVNLFVWDYGAFHLRFNGWNHIDRNLTNIPDVLRSFFFKKECLHAYWMQIVCAGKPCSRCKMQMVPKDWKGWERNHSYLSIFALMECQVLKSITESCCVKLR